MPNETSNRRPAEQNQPSHHSKIRRALPALEKKDLVIAGLFAALFAALLAPPAAFIPDITRRWKAGPDTYKIYLLARRSASNDPDDPSIAQEIQKGFEDAKGEQKLQFMDKDITLAYRELPAEATDDPNSVAKTSKDILRNSDVLMVIAALGSTETKAALPVFFEEAQPPVPVVLTFETNPNLLPDELNDTHFPIFRLAPKDDSQAERVVDFANSVHRGGKFWLVRDSGNIVYSDYLEDKLLEKIYDGGGMVLLRSTIETIPPVDSIRELGIDWVVFTGDWKNALVLVHQLRAMFQHGKMPSIILTDSGVNKKLLTEGRDEVEDTYVTYPIKAQDMIRKGSSDIDYSIYGRNAYLLISQLLAQAEKTSEQSQRAEGGMSRRLRRLLGLQRISDARNELDYAINAGVDQKKYHLANRRVCRFAVDGTRRDASGSDASFSDCGFAVWQVKGGQFSDVDAPMQQAAVSIDIPVQQPATSEQSRHLNSSPVSWERRPAVAAGR